VKGRKSEREREREESEGEERERKRKKREAAIKNFFIPKVICKSVHLCVVLGLFFKCKTSVILNLSAPFFSSNIDQDP
jgi:hypothetical protein